MNQPKPSIYRDALQVSPERIAAMHDKDLNLLMGQLFRAQAYRCGSPRNQIRINTEENAKDGGCDGWSSTPTTPDPWLGSTDTCWQFKAGSSGEPKRLVGEVTKRIPKDTLTRGGRFVVVASGSKNGIKGEDDRRQKLTDEAKSNNIPTDRIDVFGSERLANWCNQHPAVAAYWSGLPDGLWTLDDWAKSDEHQVPYQASEVVQRELDARRANLDISTGEVYHFHIQGPPGVGKTRFALELCRGAAWSDTVIYIRQAADPRLFELIDSAATDQDAQLTVVADEVQAQQLRLLRDSVGRGNGRLRLITIGHSTSPDPSRIPAMAVKPLDHETMRAIVKGWHQAMPREHVEFVVRFAGGYVRLARLAADAVVRNPVMNMRGLLSRDEIRGFLDEMLGQGDRQALYVVAVLNNVGWTDEMQGEGKSIAGHFGLDWKDVRTSVEDFHRRLGIVPQGGRFRYISPTPLGIYLAVEAWTAWPDLLKSLPNVLPSDRAREVYYERLQSIASDPQARVYAREELAHFFQVDDFFDARDVRRWSALSSADPDRAAHNFLQALRSASLEDRKRIQDRARREAVGTLVRLAWKSSAFHDAVKALALLAEAENETWANNATGEFVARFQIFLGGTALPYLDRLSVLDELLEEDRASLASLVVKALTRVGNQFHSRLESGHASDELPEKEWHPRSGNEHLECVETALIKLTDIAKRGITDIQTDFIVATKELSMMLHESFVRHPVASFFDAVREAYLEAREPLRRIIADIIHSERNYWKSLPQEALEELENLHARFEDSSLAARLQQYVGETSWDWEEEPDLRPLAEELMSAPEALAEHWPWLTSGKAGNAWLLGKAFAEVDSKGELAETLPLIPGGGHDHRLLCGYITARRATLGDQWYDEWVRSQFERVPKPVALLFEIASRCGVTEPVAHMLSTSLRSEQVTPEVVGQLGFAQWDISLTVNSLEAVLRAMVDRGHRETAIGILDRRMKANPMEFEHWKPLALELVTTSNLIRSKQMASYCWGEVARTLIADYSSEIAAAIFREQADRKSPTWFAEFSPATAVLHACAKQDPNGVWQAMQPYLSSRIDAHRFGTGFPKGLLDQLPTDEVMAWVGEESEERAEMVTRIAKMDFSTDETLASRIIGLYGDNEPVASACFSEYVSGMWSGSAAAHWNRLADSLENVAERTAMPKLRRWAEKSVRSLRQMAERDLQREEEEDLLWR